LIVHCVFDVTLTISFVLAPTQNLLSYTDTQFDWKNINNWQGDVGTSADFASGGFSNKGIEVSTFGRSYERSQILRTRQGWSGPKIIFIEWTSYDGSDTNIWMTPTILQNQFGDSRWPNCGEYDIFEMFNGDAAIGNDGTKDFFYGGSLQGFGQSTMHMSSTTCFAPLHLQKPMVTSTNAQFQISYGTKTSMAVVYGTDGNGQYIQQIQNPSFTTGSNNTYDISVGGGTATAKIYNNDQLYWGVSPTGGCSSGHDSSSGYPFFNEFRLILQEQYKGKFFVSNIQIFKKN